MSVFAWLLGTFLEEATSLLAAHGVLHAFAIGTPTLQSVFVVFPGTPTWTVFCFLWCQKSNQEEVEEDEEHSISSSASHEDSSSSTKSIEACTCDHQCHDIGSAVGALVLVAVAVIISTLALIHPEHCHKDSQLKIWGGIAASTNAMLWLPQIVKTWNMQNGGVLSVPALGFAAFGDFLLGVYWVFDGETCWLWGSLVSDSVMQMIFDWHDSSLSATR